MLVRHYVVFVFGIERLVLRRHVDLVVGQFVLAEVFEEIGVAGAREVDVGVGGVFGHFKLGCVVG